MENLVDLNIAFDSLYYLYRSGDLQTAKELEGEIISKAHSKSTIAVLKLLNLINQYECRIFTAVSFEELKTISPEIGPENQLYLGWMNFLKGFFSKDEASLKKAITHFKSNRLVNELYEAYYWLDCFKFNLTLDEQIFLHLYPCKSVYSKLMGNLFYSSNISHTNLQKHQCEIWGDEEEMEESFDCWLIDEKNCVPVKYTSVELGDKNFIDFFSGLSNDRGEYIYLMLTELNTLALLISSGIIGMSLYELAEFLNCEEEKAAATIQNLVDLGFKISQKNSLYTLAWKQQPIFVIPRSLRVKGLQEFVKKKTSQFNKSQLMELLHITPHGANLLIKKWSQAGVIQPVNDQWKFN